MINVVLFKICTKHNNTGQFENYNCWHNLYFGVMRCCSLSFDYGDSPCPHSVVHIPSSPKAYHTTIPDFQRIPSKGWGLAIENLQLCARRIKIVYICFYPIRSSKIVKPAFLLTVIDTLTFTLVHKQNWSPSDTRYSKLLQ